MNHVNYFAYGSNMSAPRLHARVGVVECCVTGFVRGYRLRFHKVGRDGSGKCDAHHTGIAADRVHGVVYRLDPARLPTLDAFEDIDVGYRRAQVTVETSAGGLVEALTYLALRTDPALRPLDWYKAHVLDGARAAGLPGDYIRMIEEVPVRTSDI